MASAKPHRIVHPAWAQWLDAREVAAALRVAEGEGWPPAPAPAVTMPSRPLARDARAPQR